MVISELGLRGESCDANPVRWPNTVENMPSSTGCAGKRAHGVIFELY